MVISTFIMGYYFVVRPWLKFYSSQHEIIQKHWFFCVSLFIILGWPKSLYVLFLNIGINEELYKKIVIKVIDHVVLHFFAKFLEKQ